jgi:hypothetical protein
VTVAAALIWAVRPELESYQVADIVEQSARRTASDWTPEMGCGTLDAGAALELATSRPASEWAATPNTDGAVCSALGDAPATWPTEANQTVTFDPLPNRTLGERDFTLDASASSELPITFAAGGNCVVTGVTAHLTGAGYCTITASQAGDENFNPASAVAHTFEIAPAPAMSVHASAASGRWGKNVALRFRVDTGDVDVAARTIALHRGAVVARLALDFFRAEPGLQYAFSWHAPRTRTAGAYRFCVTLVNRADETSAPDCKSIRLR